MERPPSIEIPDAPGAYFFRDDHGRVIYVGKAKSLRKRIASYFGRELALRTSAMVESARDVEWIVASSEVEAIMLEYSLIKQYRPRFNIRLRDDKSYPYLAITRSDQWPRAHVMRGRRRRGTAYFGPYAHTYAIRKTLDLVLRTFPVRTCSDSMFRRQQLQGRPCLLFHIEKCSGPCVGEVTGEDYQKAVEGLSAFLQGDIDQVVEEITARMHQSSEALEYESAARYRDRLADLEKALARQEMVTDRREDFDLIAGHGDELETAIWVLFVRRGRVVGRMGSVVDRVEEVSERELAGSIIRELYGDRSPPSLVLIADLPPDPETFRAWLAERRGGPVELRVPKRGGKRRLMETAAANAREMFGRHRLRRQADHNARARALRSLQEVLGAARSAIAHRGLRCLHPHGDSHRGLHGGDGGRSGPQVRIPAFQDQESAGAGRLRRHGRGDPQEVHRLSGQPGPPRPSADPLSVSAFPGGDRRRCGAVGKGGAGAGRTGIGHSGGGVGQAHGGSVFSRLGRAASDLPPSRGALSPAAHSGRGSPVCSGVSP